MDKQFVGFKISDNFYCIDVDKVQRVLKVDKITWMPDAPGFVEGIISLRGIIVPVISMKKKLNLREKKEEVSSEDKEQREKKVIIVNINNVLVGLLVDDFSYVFSTSDSAIQRIDVTKTEKERREMIKGILKSDNILYSLIDVEKVLEKEEANFINREIVKK